MTRPKGGPKPYWLYFETMMSEGKVKHYWLLKGTNGHPIGSSHKPYGTKRDAMENAVRVMGKELFDGGRHQFVDQSERRLAFSLAAEV